MRADRLEIPHQADRIAVGQGQRFHIHDRIGKAGMDEHVAEIVHVDEPADVGRRIGGNKRRTQLLERVRAESGE